MPTPELRPLLARDGIFNARDLGGIATDDGRVLRSGRLVRADALHRSSTSAQALLDHGIVRVIDLRDDRERDEAGVLVAEGIDVVHQPLLDPTFEWLDDTHPEPATLLAHRYELILSSFPDRFAGAVDAIVSTVADPERPGGVAYHCAVGKDRTGLLTALLLDVLGVPDETIVSDYVRSSAATAVQVSWLWALGLPGGSTTDDELEFGVWSARPETMQATLAWLRSEDGGAEAYLVDAGVASADLDALQEAVLTEPGD